MILTSKRARAPAARQTRIADKKVALEVTDAAKEIIVGEDFDPVYGARPLRRAIQKLIQDPLAMKMLEGEFTEGDSIVVDAADGKITFAKDKRRAKVKAKAEKAEAEGARTAAS